MIKRLLKKLHSQLKLCLWVTRNQKKLLFQYISFWQISFFIFNLKYKIFQIFHGIDLLFNNLWLQVYAVELLKLKSRLKSNKKLLFELKCFRHKNVLFLKKIYIWRVNDAENFFFVTDLLIQRLFTLVLALCVKARTKVILCNSQNNKTLHIFVDLIKNSLYYRVNTSSKLYGHTFFFCISPYATNYSLLFKYSYIPLKYEHVLSDWLNINWSERFLTQKYRSNFKIFVIEVIRIFMQNFFFSECRNWVYFQLLKLKKINCKTFEGLLSNKVWYDICRRRFLCWDFFWTIEGGSFFSDSRKFLSVIKRKADIILLARSSPIKIIKIETYIFLLVLNVGIATIIKNLFSTKSKAQKFNTQDLFSCSSFVNISRLKKILNANFAAGRNYSVYILIAILNATFEKVVDYFVLSFQKIWSSMQNWFYRQFLAWLRCKYLKNSKISLYKHYWFIKYCKFRNYFDVLHSVQNCLSKRIICRNFTRVKELYLIKKISRNFFGLAKKKSEKCNFVIPKINIILGLRNFKKV